MAPNKKYIVRLDDAERQSLQRMVRSGRHAASKLTRARVLSLRTTLERAPLRAVEAVPTETPASRATSRMVMRAFRATGRLAADFLMMARL